jgi:hypothetical protein
MSKVRISRNGARTGGGPLTRGALYVMLRNRTYIGQVAHRGVAYPGQHAAIVDLEIFERTQQLLDSNGVRKRAESRADASALLTGRLWDGEGRPMTPTHTTKGAKRYRYYKTRDLGGDNSKALRVPAGELESLVLARLQAFLLDTAHVHDALVLTGTDAPAMNQALERARVIGGLMDGTSASPILELRDAIAQVEVRPNEVLLQIDLGVLLLQRQRGATVDLAIPSKIVRRTREIRLIVPPRGERKRRADAGLIKLIVRAREVRASFESCGSRSLAEIAKKLGYNPDYCGVLLKLGYLSPSIIQSILDGTQPEMLTRQHLARVRALPIAWDEQDASMRNLEHGDVDPRLD